MNINIRPFSEDKWYELSEFFRNNWRDGEVKNHPMLDKKMFDWQLTGFGEKKGTSNTRILYDGEKIIGLNYIIPGKYQVPINGEIKIINGKSMSILLVDHKYRGQKLGFKLLNEIYEDSDVCEDLGVNRITAAPIHYKNNFCYIDALHRYVRPIIAEGYSLLLRDEVDINLINDYINANPIIHNDSFPFIENIDFDQVEKLWKSSTYKVGLFSLNRIAEFWRWRYYDNVGFKYYFFGNMIDDGLVIARLENVISEDYNKSNKKILRIIEIIPADSDVWNGSNSIKLENLINNVLGWAKTNNCCAADFQISNSRLSFLLSKVGFLYQSNDYGNGINSLAGLFQPLVYEPSPINAFWKVRYENNIVNIGANDTYIVKSDNDMDRPNIWPVN